MSNQFKPGDPALTLVHDADVPQGSQVEIVDRIAKGQVLRAKGEVFIAPSAGWFVTHPCIAPRKTAYGDAELMPLSGDFAPEQQKAKAVPV
ncbi:hypothetical protein K5D38_05005 [Pseudomonas cichorii]|nr:hypothetical protein [Pseudomonas cichorii]MBX8474131.1 hypothetical protein [Pseudomonas cichorii]GFM48984.1 hypothetical protein PSCICE_02510 [Pseudomonas cichorii]